MFKAFGGAKKVETGEKKEEAKIVRIPISRAIPGMIVARDIYTRSDQVILNAGTELDARAISKIMFHSVDSISVYENHELQEEKELTLTEQLKQSVDFREFYKQYDEAVNDIRETMERLADGEQEISQEQLIEKIELIVSGCSTKSGIFNMLHCIRNFDEVTYMHSVNVALIGNCFGKWLGMSEENQRILTLSGLLHDIGKTTIPKEILLKPDSLTEAEYEIVKTHTLRGYDILKDKNLDPRVKLVALQHHERADRSGYPYRKSADEIDQFSMIISIADVYDAMTSDRVYRPKLCPFNVIQDLESQGNVYNPNFLVPLLEQITKVYINHTVRLSDDSVGKIVLMNNQELSKPVIQVDDIFVDLTKKRTLGIKEIL